MKSKTLSLFIISALILLGAFLFSIFKTTYGDDANFITGVIAAISLGMGIAGLIIGFGEIRNSRNTKNWIGLIGNLMVVGLFILITVLAFRLKKTAHNNVYKKWPGGVYGKVLSF